MSSASWYIWLLLGTPFASAAGLVWCAHRLRLARAALDSLHQTQRAVQTLNHLPGQVRLGEWHKSLHAVLDTMIEAGYGSGAAVYALTEDGKRELKCWVSRDRRQPAEEEVAPLLKEVIASQEPRLDAEKRCCLPVRDGADVIALLVVEGAASQSPEGGHPVWDGAAAVIGLTLSGLRYFQRASLLSTTDGLTGLANHRHFHQVLGVYLAQSYLRSVPVCLLLADIDHFKWVNDTYGHLFGDMVLREVAQAARRVMPEGAMVARYGGEEFAVILPATPQDRARQIGEELRGAVQMMEVCEPSSRDRVEITISVGVAQYELGTGKSRLIAAADEALYASKRAGRNRVTCAELGPLPVA